jgi:hypothetical protein
MRHQHLLLGVMLPSNLLTLRRRITTVSWTISTSMLFPLMDHLA